MRAKSWAAGILAGIIVELFGILVTWAASDSGNAPSTGLGYYFGVAFTITAFMLGLVAASLIEDEVEQNERRFKDAIQAEVKKALEAKKSGETP